MKKKQTKTTSVKDIQCLNVITYLNITLFFFIYFFSVVFCKRINVIRSLTLFYISGINILCDWNLVYMQLNHSWKRVLYFWGLLFILGFSVSYLYLQHSDEMRQYIRTCTCICTQTVTFNWDSSRKNVRLSN